VEALSTIPTFSRIREFSENQGFRDFAVIRIRNHPLLSARDRFGLLEEM